MKLEIFVSAGIESLNNERQGCFSFKELVKWIERHLNAELSYHDIERVKRILADLNKEECETCSWRPHGWVSTSGYNC